MIWTKMHIVITKLHSVIVFRNGLLLKTRHSTPKTSFKFPTYGYGAYPPERAWGLPCVIFEALHRSTAHSSGPESSPAWATGTTLEEAGNQCTETHSQSLHSHRGSGTYSWAGNSGHYGRSRHRIHTPTPSHLKDMWCRID